MITPINTTKEFHNKPQQPKKYKDVIEIQFCASCDNHSFIIRHQQSKYRTQYDKLKTKLAQNPLILVRKKLVPAGFTKKSAYCPPNIYYRQPNNQMVFFPRIGSFEVYLNGISMFSKIENQKWPNIDQLAQKISTIIQSGQSNILKKEDTEQDRQKQSAALVTEPQNPQRNNYPIQRFEKKSYFIRGARVEERRDQKGRYSLHKRSSLFRSTNAQINQRRNSFRHDKSMIQEQQIRNLWIDNSIKSQRQRQVQVRKNPLGIYLQPIAPPKKSVNHEQFLKRKMQKQQILRHRKNVSLVDGKTLENQIDSIEKGIKRKPKNQQKKTQKQKIEDLKKGFKESADMLNKQVQEKKLKTEEKLLEKYLQEKKIQVTEQQHNYGQNFEKDQKKYNSEQKQQEQIKDQKEVSSKSQQQEQERKLIQETKKEKSQKQLEIQNQEYGNQFEEEQKVKTEKLPQDKSESQNEKNEREDNQEEIKQKAVALQEQKKSVSKQFQKSRLQQKQSENIEDQFPSINVEEKQINNQEKPIQYPTKIQQQ